MKNKQVIEKLQNRKASLEKWLKTRHNDEFSEDEKSLNATNYLIEISDLISSVELINKEIYIVTSPTMEQKSKKADFSTVEEEGYFFKLVLIQTFPYEDIYLLCLTPLSAL